MNPQNVLHQLTHQIPERQTQICEIYHLCTTPIPPQVVVLHGTEATGKSLTMTSTLEALPDHSVAYAIVRSNECVTSRHLMERALSLVKQAVVKTIERFGQDMSSFSTPTAVLRCENLSVFMATLQSLVAAWTLRVPSTSQDTLRRRFILVFDGIDRQRELGPTLIPALCRLAEYIPQLMVVLVMTRLQPQLLNRAAVPAVFFPAYTRDQIIQITYKTDLGPIWSQNTGQSPHRATAPPIPPVAEPEQLRLRFITAVWDTYGQAAASDLYTFKRICQRLWPAFTRPIVEDSIDPQDFPRLLVRNRRLLQDEKVLSSSIITLANAPSHQPTPLTNSKSLKLPSIASYLLLSAYLASYSAPRLDITLFSRTALAVKKKRGGGTRAGARSRKTKISRQLLGASSYTLERLLSIFNAIITAEGAGTIRSGSAEVIGQYATLIGLRMIVRLGGAGGSTADILDPGTKWRVYVNYETIRDVAASVRFNLDEYIIE